jgi:intracellular septation protein
MLGIYGATAVFMVAVLVSLALGYMRERKLSPMPLFTAVLVMVFGGLTLYLKNDTFIKMKPTVLYAFIGVLLLGGLAFNRLFIKYVFAQAFDLSEQGWRKLTWRWALFALALAVTNEIVWRSFSTAIWVDFKVWAIMPLIFLFALAQTPLVLRHGNPTASEQDRND